jgi:hypothetical protein
MFNKIPPEQLLAEVEDILRTMPETQSLGNDSDDVLAWLGRASAAVDAWDSSKGVDFKYSVRGLGSSLIVDFTPAVRGVRVMLHQARHDLRMRTVGPLSENVAKGAVFDYFDELRQVIEIARTDLLFVDPYLDAEFVSRYLPHVSAGVSIRLLGRERIASLTSAVQVLRTQSSLAIEVRSAEGFHDRYLFVDRVTCHQSGASFKDGAKKAPTTLTQITDAFTAMLKTYEDIWATGKVAP